MNASVLTHNGCITIQSNKTGEHRTFEIKTRDFNGEKKRVISLLAGPNNEADYIPFGFVGSTGVYVWRRHQDSEFFTKIAKLLPVIHLKNIRYEFETKCRVCNRRLTTIESIESGIGAICASRF